MNSKKFQLIAPGRDGCYGRTVPSSLISNPGPSNFPNAFTEVRLLPNCIRVIESTDTTQLLPDTELDNQTNFTSGKLGDERP